MTQAAAAAAAAAGDDPPGDGAAELANIFILGVPPKLRVCHQSGNDFVCFLSRTLLARVSIVAMLSMSPCLLCARIDLLPQAAASGYPLGRHSCCCCRFGALDAHASHTHRTGRRAENYQAMAIFEDSQQTLSACQSSRVTRQGRKEDMQINTVRARRYGSDMRAAMKKQSSKKIAIKPAAVLLLIGQLLFLLATTPIATQASSSSYLDDYFSTAKYALNKLQQSLTSGSGAGSAGLNSPASELQAAAADKSITPTFTIPSETTTPTITEATTSNTAPDRQSNLAEPDRNEFVKLDTLKEQVEQKQVFAQTEAANQESISSTESPTIVVSAQTDQDQEQDETTTTSGKAAEQPVVLEAVSEKVGGRDGPSLLELPALGSSSSSGSNKIEELLRPIEETIKETEMNAVAAVEASINFGNDLNLFSGQDKLIEPCYDEYGNPRFCEPEFENVASERQVQVSSECGQPASRFCTTTSSSSSPSSISPAGQIGGGESQIRNCHICDAQHPKKRHPASHLTDLNNPNNPTCWVSAPVSVAAHYSTENSSAISADSPSNNSMRADNVTLVLNLDKRYEILYVSLQFCSLKPDSLAIYKSNDFGHSWQPYQFYSSYCERLYNRQPSSSSSSSSSSQMRPPLVSQQQQQQPQEATCANVSSSGGSSATRVAFSTLDGARIGFSLEKSVGLQEWISATNIKITLDRHQAAWIQSTLALHSGRLHSIVNSAPTTTPEQPQAQKLSTTIPANTTAAISGSSSSSQELTNPSSDTFNYAISDLAIGGRCKCNGHASRCIHAKDGRLQCDCRHNTAGRDCEKCAPLHADRPWARATPTEANICQACNCNGHSRKCKFDPDLYRLSGKRSGGVCQQCKDNTDGRYCHYCREGFTRDHSKPMSDKEACKACDCHPIGSLGRVCNQTNGQCPCKEGVTGLLCNRCAPGYQQSSSQSEPCIRIPPPPETNNEIINNELTPVTPSGIVDEEEQPTIDQVGTDQPVIGDTKLDQQQHPAQTVTTSRAPSGGSDPRQPPWSANVDDRDWGPDRDRMQTNGRIDPLIDAGAENQGALRANQQQIKHQQYNPGWQYWQTTGVARKHQVNGAGYPPARYPGRRQPIDPQDGFAGGDQEQDQQDSINRQSMRADIYRNEPNDDDYPLTRDRIYKQQRHSQDRYRQRHYKFVPPIANIDETDLPPDEHYLQPQLSSIYNDDFNQINSARDSHLHRRPPILQHQQQHPSRNHLGQSAVAARRRFEPTVVGVVGGSPSVSVSNLNGNVHPNVNNYNSIITDETAQCGDCHSNQLANTRRLKVSQFCQLDFAIRCTIRDMLMAEDWTKLDIEIQDIFKSPASNQATIELNKATSSSSQQNANVVAKTQTSQQMNFVSMMQQDASDAPVVSDDHETPAIAGTSNSNITNKTANNNNELFAGSHLNRLKVGTVQSIWVPTEDLACKCPRLKLKSTYLLMGTIDTKENSVNSLQLDRHGVALEWRPALQKRMMHLQRRYARGSICV